MIFSELGINLKSCALFKIYKKFNYYLYFSRIFCIFIILVCSLSSSASTNCNNIRNIYRVLCRIIKSEINLTLDFFNPQKRPEVMVRILLAYFWNYQHKIFLIFNPYSLYYCILWYLTNCKGIESNYYFLITILCLC